MDKKYGYIIETDGVNKEFTIIHLPSMRSVVMLTDEDEVKKEVYKLNNNILCK